MMFWWLFAIPLAMAAPIIAIDAWDVWMDPFKGILPPEDKK